MQKAESAKDLGRLKARCSLGAMSRGRKLLDLCFASVLAAMAGLSLFNLSLDQAMRSTIAGAPLPVEAQIVDWQRCALDMMGSRDSDTSRCELKWPAHLHVPSFVKELSADAARQDSGRATLWFMLAAFSFPLSFGGAGLLGFLLFRD